MRTIFKLLFLMFLMSFLSMNGQEEQMSPNFIFQQKNIEQEYIGVGYYKYYNNALSMRSGNYKVTLNAGIVEQGLYDGSSLGGLPILQNYVGVEAEYSLNRWIAMYVNGQYVDAPFYNARSEITDIYMNPLFAQSGYNMGFRGEVNTMKFDLGVGSLNDTQYNISAPKARLNMKVLIGF